MTLRECYDEVPLKGYLDDALPANEREEMDAHLATCGDCRQRLDEMHMLAQEVKDTLEMHIDVPDARIALARLHVAQRANGRAGRVVTANAPVESAPALNVRAAARFRQPQARGGRMRLALAGVGVALAIVLALGLTVFFAPRSHLAVQNLGISEPFLPAGKVRHMVLTGVTTVEGGAKNASPQTKEEHHEEFWLIQGNSHPLMRDQVTVPVTGTNWLNDDSYYEYQPAQGNQAHKYAYDPKYLAAVLPDPELVTKTLQMQGARLLGNDMLGGRPVVVVEVSRPGSPDTTVSTKYWIDEQTDQLAQYESTTTNTGGPQNGLIERHLNKIALYELRDRGEFPDDYFTFKLPPGATLIDSKASVGEAAPDFSLPNIRTGKPVTLSSLQGKPVMLQIWGTWCPPCRDNTAHVKDMYNKWQGTVEFVSISFGSRDDLATVRDFVQANDYPWTFLHDATDSILHLYDTSAVPVFYFIDSTGTIKEINIGSASTEQLLNGLQKIGAPVNPSGVPAPDMPGWYTFTSPYGAFSVLMPRAMVDVGGTNDWSTFGVKSGAVTYISAYRDYTGIANPDNADKWLDQELPALVTGMNGTSKGIKPITLDGHIGRESAIARFDGRFTRSRIYLVGTRIYNVYAIASDEKRAFSEDVTRYLDSFKLLTP